MQKNMLYTLLDNMKTVKMMGLHTRLNHSLSAFLWEYLCQENRYIKEEYSNLEHRWLRTTPSCYKHITAKPDMYQNFMIQVVKLTLNVFFPVVTTIPVICCWILLCYFLTYVGSKALSKPYYSFLPGDDTLRLWCKSERIFTHHWLWRMQPCQLVSCDIM